MILTLATFQKGARKLPNAVAAPNGADNTADIQAYIDRFERDILIKGLGTELYDLVKASYTGETLKPDAEQRIKDLVTGMTYEVDGKKVAWEGLSPLLGDYVFYKYWTEMTRIKRDNDDKFTDPPKAVHAYQSFHEKYQGYDAGPRTVFNGSSYGLDWYGSRKSDRSLLQFLTDNSDTYPEAELTPLEGMNSMGI